MPPFDQSDVDQVNEWLVKWDEYRQKKPFGHPDWTSDAIYLLPLTISLFKSEETLQKITRWLIVLTVVLVFETAILIWKSF